MGKMIVPGSSKKQNRTNVYDFLFKTIKIVSISFFFSKFNQKIDRFRHLQNFDFFFCQGLIVIEKKQSEENEELARQDERHGAMLRQWIKSIYLIVDTQQGVIAVNLQRRTEGPPGRTQELSWHRFYYAVEAQCAEALERTEHYIGGPVEPGLKQNLKF